MQENSKMGAEGLPVEYRPSGTSGHASSTISGKASALVHFDKFLKTKKMKSFHELTENQLCDIKLFQEFGTYLCEFATKRGKVTFLTILKCCKICCNLLLMHNLG